MHLLGAVFFPKVLELIITDFLYHVECLADEFLLDYLQQLVLLKCFTRYVQRQIIRVHLHQQQQRCKYVSKNDTVKAPLVTT